MISIHVFEALSVLSAGLSMYNFRRSRVRVKQVQANTENGTLATCGKCGSLVARFYFQNGFAVCANCDPTGFAASRQG